MFRYIEAFSPLEVHVQTEDPSEAGLKKHFEYVTGRMRARRMQPLERRKTYVIQVNGPDFRQANAAERGLLANWIKQEFELMQTTSLGLSFVIDSAIIRGALTAVFWLSKTPMPQRVHATLEDAYTMAIRELEGANIGVPQVLWQDGVGALRKEMIKAGVGPKLAKASG